jgi:glycosyltransferase involved in cell wall biosynthesis
MVQLRDAVKTRRIGFVLADLGNSWLGGLNYYRSLLTALEARPERRVEPVLFIGKRTRIDAIGDLKDIKIVRSAMLDKDSVAGLLLRSTRKLLNWQGALYALLVHHRIDVLSHFGPIRPAGKLKTIGWLPDFQHIHLPEFFSNAEIRKRNAAFKKTSAECDVVLISSESARKDLAAFAPESIHKARVLHFVPHVLLSNENASESGLARLQEKYGFTDPFFFLPNQFWAHKNHKLVLEALATLKRRNVQVKVLASGNPNDTRSPQHYASLMQYVEQLNLGTHFSSLGVIPYGDLIGLMHHSVAVINPSLFEGWSTTVEEAKALNKIILLSDLPVHREQQPTQGIYFDPRNKDQLAELLISVHNGAIHPTDRGIANAHSHEAKRRAFAVEFEDISLSLLD